MAGPREVIARRAEEVLRRAGQAGVVARVADELPQVAGLLEAQPSVLAALTDIGVRAAAKKELVADLLGARVDAFTLELVGLLVEEPLAPEELLAATRDLVTTTIMIRAREQGVLRQVEDELFRFARTVDGAPDLRSALTDPRAPGDARREIVRSLLESRALPETVALAVFVLERTGPRDPARALEEVAEQAAARRGQVLVEARAAVPIDVQRRQRLTEALSRTVGRQVDLEVVLDPSVVGGVVARIGDEVIDGSVKRKLERALEELTT